MCAGCRTENDAAGKPAWSYQIGLFTCSEQPPGLAVHRPCSCLLFASRPAPAPAEFCCWGTLSLSLALEKAVGADWSSWLWQGQCWEQPSAQAHGTVRGRGVGDITLSTKTVREGSQAGLCIHRCVCCDSSPSLLSLGAPAYWFHGFLGL